MVLVSRRGTDLFEKFVTVVLNAGGTMLFDEMVQQVRVQGGRPELWLRAKHAGVIETYLENRQHWVRLPQAQPEGGA